MKLILFVLGLTSIIFTCCTNTTQPTENKTAMQNKKASSVCTGACSAENKATELSCKLTTPELQQRKATVLTSLRQQIVQKKELEYGYAYKFAGSDKVVDELAEFIKTERECCNFFTFNLSISGDKSEAWLELTGGDGVKDFIKTELEL